MVEISDRNKTASMTATRRVTIPYMVVLILLVSQQLQIFTVRFWDAGYVDDAFHKGYGDGIGVAFVRAPSIG